MDNEHLDDELVNRARSVFENFEDPGADDNWLALRERYPEKEKDRGIIWLWWASAAAVLLLLFGLWFFNAPVKPVLTAAHHLKTNSSQNKDTNPGQKHKSGTDSSQYAVTLQQAPNKGTNSNSTGPAAVQPQQNHISSSMDLVHQSTSSHVNTPASERNSIVSNQQSPGKVSVVTAVDTSAQKSLIAQNKAIITDQHKTDVHTTPKSVDTLVLAANQKSTQPDNPAKKRSIMDLLNDTRVSKTLYPDQDKTKTEKTQKKVAFAVYAATYFNYAKGSDNEINLGAGFSTDVRLGGNFKLSTGLAIAQNSLSYGNGGPQTTQSDSPVATAISSSSYSASNITAPKQTYNASLVGLDVPVNIKYIFNPKKGDTFISAGLSSGTFIQESYHSTYTYSYASTLYSGNSGTTGSNLGTTLTTTNVTQTQEQTTHKSFGSFDFAKTLNLSFGTGYQLGKNNRLVIEPFLKYPLDGLGSEQIKFGAGGINLRLNFQTSKK